MATKDVTSAPARYEYYNKDFVISPEYAYTEGNYARFDSISAYGSVIYDGFAFSGLDSSSTIIGYKVSCQCKAGSSRITSTYYARLAFRIVTGFVQGHDSSTYTSISADSIEIYKRTTRDDNWQTCEYTNIDVDSAEVQWLRNNISKVLGGTEFGIRLYGRNLEYRNLTITLYYEENSTIYAGGGACIGGLRRRHTG